MYARLAVCENARVICFDFTESAIENVSTPEGIQVGCRVATNFGTEETSKARFAIVSGEDRICTKHAKPLLPLADEMAWLLHSTSYGPTEKGNLVEGTC